MDSDLTAGLLVPTESEQPRLRRSGGGGPDVLLAGFVASNVAQLLGYDIGVMSGAKRVIQRDLALTTRQVETLVGSLNLVSAGGGLLSGSLADSCLGRRGTVAFACTTSVLGSVVMAFAPRAQGFAVLMVGRTLCGVAVGSGIMIAPLYISELSPKNLRGRLVSFFEVAINVGILLGYVAGWGFRNLPDDVSWRWMMGVGGVPPAMILLCLCFMPESPRWLLARGREEAAIDVLRGICEPEEAAETLKLLKIESAETPQLSLVSFSDILCRNTNNQAADCG
jgi:MFS family permease